MVPTIDSNGGDTMDRRGGPPELFPSDEDSATSLTGTISRITFRSESSGYTVARATRDGDETTFTLVGKFPPLSIGERVRARGAWLDHPKFGRQFAAESLERILPRTREAITRYLGSGLVEGIGPKLAERIVEQFGEETLEVIDQTPGFLVRVRGITESKARAIADAVKRNTHLRDLTLLLENSGLGARYAGRIFDSYGESSLRVIREDPYRLAREIWGIGFVRADALAQGLGFAVDDPRRLEAGVLAVLRRTSEAGDVYLPFEELAKHTTDLLRVDLLQAEEGIQLAIQSGDVVREDDRIYPRLLYNSELFVAEHLRQLLEGSRLHSALAFDPRGLESLQRNAGVRLSTDQVEALERAHASRIFVLTGGPGTGKTTLTRFLLDLFEAHQLTLVLAAPTGRAARRLTEATGREAQTIHRLLGFDPQNGSFNRDASHPIDADVVLVDESSMMDLRIFECLLSAFPPDARLVLVGDANQLPSVGPGDVLRDLLRSGVVPSAQLEKVFRQGERSLIVENAHRILHGEEPQSSADNGEFRFLARETPEEIARTVRELVADTLPREEGLSPIRDVQVLVPMYKGESGADALNEALQSDLNPRGVEVRSGNRVFRAGDRVIQLRNDYRRNVFNGEIGIVESVDRDAGEMLVRFDELVSLPSADWDQVALAYAITVHKAQGSEYEWVVIPLSTQHALLLDRPLFYTAVTRARRGVALVGQRRALELALRPRKTRTRRSTLGDRLASPESSRRWQDRDVVA